MSGVGVKAADVLRITCFMSSLDDVQAARSAVATAFPAAAANFVQMQRLGLERQVLCEAVGATDHCARIAAGRQTAWR